MCSRVLVLSVVLGFFFLTTPVVSKNVPLESPREDAILQVQELIEKRDLPAARRLLQKSMIEFPGDAGFDNLLGVVEVQESHYGAAENSFKRAIQHDARLTAAYLNLGRLYQENAASDPLASRKALSLYDRVLQYEPGNEEANYQSASLLLREKQYEKSLTRLLRLPAQIRESAQSLSILCADYAGLGDRERVDEILLRMRGSTDLQESDVNDMLTALHAGKRDDVTVALLETLNKRQPLSAEMLHRLGLAYEASGKLDEARATLEQFVTNGDPSVASLLELARVAYEQKDYRGSLGYVAHARDLDPGNPATHYSFGMVCLQLELVAEAQNSFQKAVNLEPQNASYNYAMGAISAMGRDPSLSVPYLEKYLKLRPFDARAKLALGVVFFRAADDDAAVPWLREAAKVRTTSTMAHYYLGALALRGGRTDEAAIELETALKAKPDYVDALAESGHYYFVKREYAEAERQLVHALKLDPNHLAANFYLLSVYTRIHDPRSDAQAKHYAELQRLREEKNMELLRMVEVRPFDTP